MRMMESGTPVRALLVALLVGLALPFAGTARANTDQLGAGALGHQLRTRVHFAWQLRKFDELEAQATELRTTKLRDEAGMTWLLNFYGGFKECLNNHVTPADFAEKLWNEARLEWIKKYPTSPTPHVAHAHFLLELAWKARGEGTADTVFEDQWNTFFGRIQEMLQYLKENETVASTDPEYADLVARGEFLLTNDHQQLLRSIGEALKKNPRYMDYYFTAAQFSMPRWGGSVEMFYTVLMSAREGGKETDGTGLLARIYSTYYGGPFRYADIKNQGPFWPIVKQAIVDDLKHFPHWRLARKFLVLACKAGDAGLVDDLNSMMIKASKGRRVRQEPAVVCGWDNAAAAPSDKPVQQKKAAR